MGIYHDMTPTKKRRIARAIRAEAKKNACQNGPLIVYKLGDPHPLSPEARATRSME